MTGLGARRGEQHGSRNGGYNMDEVYRAIYLTGANGVASAVLTQRPRRWVCAETLGRTGLAGNKSWPIGRTANQDERSKI